MLCQPQGLDHRTLLKTIKEQYGSDVDALEFVPLGEDSWAYRAGNLWISVRRDLRGHVPAAYEAAVQLYRSGLDFILAPLPGKDARVVRRIADFPIVVFPYLEVRPLSDTGVSTREVARVIEMLASVHHSTVTVQLPVETYQLSFADDLDRVAAVPDGPLRDNGPYASRLYRLLTLHRQYVADLRSEFAELATAARETATRLHVLTHGEPIASNILRYRDRLLVTDWGDAMWAPPERDWSHVTRTIGAKPPGRPSFRRLYDIRWILSEIAEYASILLDTHADHADADAMWKRLVRYLPENDPIGFRRTAAT
jgi:spectinomycin phosphotransferase